MLLFTASLTSTLCFLFLRVYNNSLGKEQPRQWLAIIIGVVASFLLTDYGQELYIRHT